MIIKVPDFYKNFHCKCGTCRHCCCNGWDITLSFEEYYKLLGIECSKELREKLDRSFHMIPNGGRSEYAKINRNYKGDCPLQNEQGLCSLQRELGEDSLPRICRLYPRNIIYCAMDEGSLSNSCEGVIEELIKNEDKITVTTIDSPNAVSIPVDDNTKLIQKSAFELLSDRTISLEERLIKFGEVFDLKAGDFAIYNKDETFKCLFNLIKALQEYSPTFNEYSIIAEKEIEFLNENFDLDYFLKRYQEAKEKFMINFPKSQIWFEKIMTNHLFYTRFPYNKDKTKTLLDNFCELAGIFVIYKFTLIAYCESRPTIESFVDCTSALFRCFEHSSASKVINFELRRLGKLSYSFIKTTLENT